MDGVRKEHAMSNKVVKTFQEGQFLVEICEVEGIPTTGGDSRFIANIRRIAGDVIESPFSELKLNQLEELESLVRGAVISIYGELGWSQMPREV
jgi:hypothetical protein